MKLHIFNPEHEMALACNMKYFTVSHSIQELRMNLGWMPALWADDGDAVLVDDARFAIKASMRMGDIIKDVLFLEKEQLHDFVFDSVCPWGWNLSLYTRLKELNVNVKSFLAEEDVQNIRNVSSRRQTTGALEFLRSGIESVTCGENVYASSLNEVERCLDAWKNIVVKAPWSSSGRGIRYVDRFKFAVADKWINNIIRRQGGVMVEPFYSKVKDFGMEFCVEEGHVAYKGLSLFHTINGAYSGSLLTTEEEKMDILRKYLPVTVITLVKERICEYMQRILTGVYEGPFGVDMMIVSGGGSCGFLLHPCVEINVRRTMGHVALSFPVSDCDPKKLMQIVHNVNYQLKLSSLENNYVQTV